MVESFENTGREFRTAVMLVHELLIAFRSVLLVATVLVRGCWQVKFIFALEQAYIYVLLPGRSQSYFLSPLSFLLLGNNNMHNIYTFSSHSNNQPLQKCLDNRMHIQTSHAQLSSPQTNKAQATWTDATCKQSLQHNINLCICSNFGGRDNDNTLSLLGIKLQSSAVTASGVATLLGRCVQYTAGPAACGAGGAIETDAGTVSKPELNSEDSKCGSTSG